MHLDDCKPGLKLLWRFSNTEPQLKAVRVIAVTASRVIVLANIRGQAVRRAVKPARLHQRQSAPLTK